jgi:hypothetical protein
MSRSGAARVAGCSSDLFHAKKQRRTKAQCENLLLKSPFAAFELNLASLREIKLDCYLSLPRRCEINFSHSNLYVRNTLYLSRPPACLSPTIMFIDSV